jgi:hypothetical protein
LGHAAGDGAFNDPMALGALGRVGELLQPIDQSEILVNGATSRVPIDQLLGIGQTH